MLRCLIASASLLFGAMVSAYGAAAPASTTRPPLEDLCANGVAAVLHGDTARAETLFVAHLAKKPDDPCALTNLGNLARLRGDLDEARVFYRMASQADTTDSGVLLNYAAVLHELKDPDAESVYRRALGQSSLHEILGRLALRRTSESDSLQKGANISSMIPGVMRGKRMPDARLVALIGIGHSEVRKSTKPDEEIRKADDAVLASLPVYWKN
jgi:hypothetical protein